MTVMPLAVWLPSGLALRFRDVRVHLAVYHQQAKLCSSSRFERHDRTLPGQSILHMTRVKREAPQVTFVAKRRPRQNRGTRRYRRAALFGRSSREKSDYRDYQHKRHKTDQSPRFAVPECPWWKNTKSERGKKSSAFCNV